MKSNHEDAHLRQLAECLAKQVPGRSADENWARAESAFKQRPWRPWIIRFSGDKERSGWDWADLCIKISVPVLIVFLSSAYNLFSQVSQSKASKELRENQVVNDFLEQMRSMIITASSQDPMRDQRVRGAARGLTLATLSQITSPARKRIIIRYLVDSGLTWPEGRLFSLSEAELGSASLNEISLAAVNLSKAKLQDADLRSSTLSKSIFMEANLSNANLRQASLIGANLAASNLDNAELSYTLLSSANLINASIKGANLSNAALFGSDFSGADFRGAKLDEAKLTGATLVKSNLNGASLKKANLAGSDQLVPGLSSANQATLINQLRGALLIDANLENADLSMADLRGAVLAGANLRGANLREVKWNSNTVWPGPTYFTGAKNISDDLSRHINMK